MIMTSKQYFVIVRSNGLIIQIFLYFIDRSTDIASSNSSKNSSPRHAHGRRGSTDDQRRAGAIASLGGITSHNGSPVIKKSLQQSPTENNPRQRRAKSSQPSIASQQHQTQNNRRTHMPAGLQVTHV